MSGCARAPKAWCARTSTTSWASRSSKGRSTSFSPIPATLINVVSIYALNGAQRQATVNTIVPGAVFNNRSEDLQRRVSNLILAGRLGQTDEIADVMLFPASEGAGYMKGQLVSVDGGFSAW